MSTYIIENKTIDRILTYLFDNQSELKYIPWLKQPLTEKTLSGLGQDMLNMNCAAYVDRYPTEDKTPEIYPQFYFQRENKYQYLQSLTCFLYQCNEGKIPQMALYKMLDAVKLHMMNKLIADLPEMKNTKWE